MNVQVGPASRRCNTQTVPDQLIFRFSDTAFQQQGTPKALNLASQLDLRSSGHHIRSGLGEVGTPSRECSELLHPIDEAFASIEWIGTTHLMNRLSSVGHIFFAEEARQEGRRNGEAVEVLLEEHKGRWPVSSNGIPAFCANIPLSSTAMLNYWINLCSMDHPHKRLAQLATLRCLIEVSEPTALKAAVDQSCSAVATAVVQEGGVGSREEA